jgi:hypothetical protein
MELVAKRSKIIKVVVHCVNCFKNRCFLFSIVILVLILGINPEVVILFNLETLRYSSSKLNEKAFIRLFHTFYNVLALSVIVQKKQVGSQ